MKPAADATEKDIYGINNNKGYVFLGNKDNKSASNGACSKDSKHKGFSKGSVLKIEYRIKESKLIFYENSQLPPIYTINLPQDQSITHWHPFVTLYSKNDTCRLHGVEIKH